MVINLIKGLKEFIGKDNYMYEKKSSNLGNGKQKKFYAMKSGKRKSSIDKKVFLIIALVFLIGILSTFLMKGNMQGNNLDKENDTSVSDNGIGDVKDSDLEAVPPVEEIDLLTDEEVNLIKSAVASDVQGYFTLANKENLVEESYVPDDLVIPNVNLVADKRNEKNLVRADAAKALEDMFSDGRKAGVNLFLNSAYRSYDSQVSIYEQELSENGGQDSKYVAKPGSSEHQLGLAVDITSVSMKFELEESFENTPEGKWALENAHKYGFILRYGADKEEITGYKYEPWHYRYVGNIEISTLCHEKNMSLEEILDYVNK